MRTPRDIEYYSENMSVAKKDMSKRNYLNVHSKRKAKSLKDGTRYDLTHLRKNK